MKQAITTAKSAFNSVYASYSQQPNGPNAPAQLNTMAALQTTMHDNTFEVLRHIVATEGSLSDYRYWLGNLDAYETDLELAKSYIGTGEYAQAYTLLNFLPTKHSLSGNKLNAFNDSRAVLNILQLHLQNGGDKYGLPNTEINTLKYYAENNASATVRGQAKAILALYGVFYPPEAALETGNRNGDLANNSASETFILLPNPADESVRVSLSAKFAKTGLVGNVSLYNLQGKLILQQAIFTGENGTTLQLFDHPNGFYFVKVQFSNGEYSTLPLIIAH
jgi:hypothetical protein